jgi:predicted O-methyltransferase YrrM
MGSAFKGNIFRTCNNWFDVIPINDKPINYLEIGTHYGANAISCHQSYAAHTNSKIYCIDPWDDNSSYPHFKGEQITIFETFLQNIKNTNRPDKFIIYKDYSNNVIPKLTDNFFDIIYIDGNHDPEYVLEDAVLSYRKLKVGGYMIFDDYDVNGHPETKRGIDGFLAGYSTKINILGDKNTQLFIKKI